MILYETFSKLEKIEKLRESRWTESILIVCLKWSWFIREMWEKDKTQLASFWSLCYR